MNLSVLVFVVAVVAQSFAMDIAVKTKELADAFKNVSLKFWKQSFQKLSLSHKLLQAFNDEHHSKFAELFVDNCQITIKGKSDRILDGLEGLIMLVHINILIFEAPKLFMLRRVLRLLLTCPTIHPSLPTTGRSLLTESSPLMKISWA